MSPDAPTHVWFSLRQRRVLSAAATVSAVSVLGAFVAGLLLAALWLVVALRGVLVPVLVAALLAMLCQPYYEWLHRHLQRRHALSLTLFFLSLLIPLAALAWGFGALFVGQIIGLLERLPEFVHNAETWLAAHTPAVVSFLKDLGLLEVVRTHLQPQALIERAIAGGADLPGRVASGAWSAIGSALGWMAVPVYLAFFLSGRPPEASDLDRFLPFLKPDTRQVVVGLAEQFQNILVAFFRGQVLVALVQAGLFAFGFALVGLDYGLVLGLGLGMLNIVPYLGNLVGLSVALPLAFVGGGWSELLLVLIVFATVQTLDSWFITPRIMGKRTGLHPVTVLFSLFFWSAVLGGFLGLALGIPLSAFVTAVGRLLRERYIREWV